MQPSPQWWEGEHSPRTSCSPPDMLWARTGPWPDRPKMENLGGLGMGIVAQRGRPYPPGARACSRVGQALRGVSFTPPKEVPSHFLPKHVSPLEISSANPSQAQG